MPRATHRDNDDKVPGQPPRGAVVTRLGSIDRRIFPRAAVPSTAGSVRMFPLRRMDIAPPVWNRSSR
jgi:hypothetical protein